MKNKRALWISLIALDVALTIFLFVIHIIMFANVLKDQQSGATSPSGTGLIGFLQNNLGVYLGAFVVPTFVVLAANIVGLVFYVRRQTKKEPVKVDDLTDEQKEALKAELLKDLQDK